VPPAPDPAPQPPVAAAKPATSAGKAATRKGAKGQGRERDVFKASAKRVRSLSQGLDQFPPGTIQLTPPSGETP
jgi:hypothetical protein